MPQQNMISVKIQEQDLTEIKEAIKTLQKKLLPALKTIKPDEKFGLSKMGDKTVAFVGKALEYCSANPELVPPFLDMAEFKLDVETVETLRSFYAPLVQITDSLSDSMLLAGSDAYSASLMFYHSVQYAQKTNVAKAGTIFNDLSSRFPGKKKQVEAS